MIATMNPDKAQAEEGMSTCRFAQRVAMVSNAVKVNEEVDPQLVIRRSPTVLSLSSLSFSFLSLPLSAPLLSSSLLLLPLPTLLLPLRGSPLPRRWVAGCAGDGVGGR